MKKSLRIAMVTGSYPPDACGVGGYTARLVRELESQGAQVDVYNKGPWEIGDAGRIAHEIAHLKADVVHIQYPTVGFNRSLGPQMVALRLPNVVATIHEVSQVHWLRRLSLYPFSIGAKALLFSNQYDRDYAARFAPWISSKTHIVPLGSSIPLTAGSNEKRNPLDVVCFGLIRPQKGIEEFLAAAAESKRRGLPFVFTVVGMQDPRFTDYFESLGKQAEGLPVRWELGLDDAAVSTRLSKAAFAYMAYPDGATERRTSMIALLAQGLAVITTKSAMTPEIFKDLLTAKDPVAAVEIIRELADDPAKLANAVAKGIALARRFDWPLIAQKHLEIYAAVAAR